MVFRISETFDERLLGNPNVRTSALRSLRSSIKRVRSVALRFVIIPPRDTIMGMNRCVCKCTKYETILFGVNGVHDPKKFVTKGNTPCPPLFASSKVQSGNANGAEDI